ncbi:MAG TPA: hypothetical protein P5230_00060 [Candidatus Magasanikbacteria bacterium]|nr:hypothetical protein [Candidatus Magasanikbacteria bacterium]
MFVAPASEILKVLKGKQGYEDIPYSRDNELLKGHKAKDQAIVNSKLESAGHSPICLATGEKCRKNCCPLYTSELRGDLKEGWICREYQVDFPTADFDSRYHVLLVGTNRIDKQESRKNLLRLKEAGANVVCMRCRQVFAKEPEFCSCDSDLFQSISSFEELL